MYVGGEKLPKLKVSEPPALPLMLVRSSTLSHSCGIPSVGRNVVGSVKGLSVAPELPLIAPLKTIRLLLMSATAGVVPLAADQPEPWLNVRFVQVISAS